MKLIKYLILSSILLVSGYIQGQFSISPQIGLSYSKFEIFYFGDLILEPVQEKAFPSLGFRLNYLNSKVLFSTSIQFSKNNNFNLRLIPGVFGSDLGFTELKTIGQNFSISYVLINNFNLGIGAKIWHYRSVNGDFFKPYSAGYALLRASYMIKKMSLELSWAKYLTTLSGATNNERPNVVTAPEIISFKIGYDIQIRKKQK